MAFVEYILLALLGSTGAAAPGGTPSSPSIRTLGAEAIVQPSGGSGLSEQATGGSTDKRKLTKYETGKKGRTVARRPNRKHQHGKGSSAAAGKKATKK
jgi:hypothetical protein